MNKGTNALHIIVQCSDTVVRRFHKTLEAVTYRDTNVDVRPGYVMYDGERVEGKAMSVGGLLVFVPTNTHSPIPLHKGWVNKTHCAAPKHCARCQRCVGDCK